MFKINDEKLKDKKIQEAVNYLSSTDWIISKINEVVLTGGDSQSLVEKYSDELTKRTEARELINKLGG